MWLLIRTAWRNLFRQRRRTIITVTAMAFSLVLAIPTWGLTEGLTKEMLRGITGMDLAHIQVHDPAYPRGKALQSLLRRPDLLLRAIRTTPGVVAAGPRVHGYGLASHDVSLSATLAPLPKKIPPKAVLFGRAPDPRAPWRTDRALACEALVDRASGRRHAIVVGTVLTPGAARPGGRCERIRIVGLTRSSLPAPSPGAGLLIGLPAQDLLDAFHRKVQKTPTVLRHSATLQIEGVDPSQEPRLTFMREKLVSGKVLGTSRYLSSKPGREMVVGWRLATILRLKVGSKVFVQAASLDQSRGDFSQSFKVVGIYRTGVDMVDRARVYVHFRDAQRLMGLGERVHEIAVVGKDARDPSKLAAKLRKVVSTRLQVSAHPRGKRAGSRPLPAPVTVYEPKGDDAALIIPYDLRRRFDSLAGLAAVTRRVYGAARVAVARQVKVEVRPVARARLRELVGSSATTSPCTIYPAKKQLQKLGVKVGDSLVTLAAALGGEEGCDRVVVGSPFDLSKLESADPQKGTIALALRASDGPDGGGQGASGRSGAGSTPSTSKDLDEADGLERGSLTLLIPGAPRKLRLVGVEPLGERRLWSMQKLVVAGAYLQKPGEVVDESESWPVMLPRRVASRMGARVGSTLLVQVRDGDGKIAWRAARVKGMLDDSRWPKGLPELVMGYYAAQQIDAPRLNARAHEMLLLPEPGVAPDALAKECRKQLTPIVRTWQQIAPDMARMIQLQDTWVAILLAIIFALAALTVMNTMLMAVFERTREFGVLKSIGMRPIQVFGLIVFETLALALIAVTLGGLGGLLLNHWAVTTGIDLSRWTGGFTYQGAFINPVWRASHSLRVILVPMIMVQVVCLLVSIYPAARAGRLKPVEAMRHNS